MSELVQRLSSGDHAVSVSIRPKSTPAALRDCIERGYVHLTFPETRGGTELFIPLEREAMDLSAANFDEGLGTVILSGRFTLDYIAVRCHASVDLTTMKGSGHLEVIAN